MARMANFLELPHPPVGWSVSQSFTLKFVPVWGRKAEAIGQCLVWSDHTDGIPLL